MSRGTFRKFLLSNAGDIAKIAAEYALPAIGSLAGAASHQLSQLHPESQSGIEKGTDIFLQGIEMLAEHGPKLAITGSKLYTKYEHFKDMEELQAKKQLRAQSKTPYTGYGDPYSTPDFDDATDIPRKTPKSLKRQFGTTETKVKVGPKTLQNKASAQNARHLAIVDQYLQPEPDIPQRHRGRKLLFGKRSVPPPMQDLSGEFYGMNQIPWTESNYSPVGPYFRKVGKGTNLQHEAPFAGEDRVNRGPPVDLSMKPKRADLVQEPVGKVKKPKKKVKRVGIADM